MPDLASTRGTIHNLAPDTGPGPSAEVNKVKNMTNPEITTDAGDDRQTCSCHDSDVHGYNADKSKYLARLRRIEGQTRGIHRMIDEDQYCIDILTQVSAVTSALENVALALLKDHIRHCVTGAAAADGELAEEKIEEAMKAIQRMVKS